jgi:type I restriction enzyme S subunit
VTAWGSAPLEELVSVVGGGTPTRSTSDYYGGSFPWVTPKDMKSWEIRGAQVNITQAGLDSSAARLVPANSVLVVVRSGVLKHTLPVAVTRLPVAINQDMKALLCGDRMDAGFLARFISSQSPTILRWVRATTADNFPVDKLKRLAVPVPPLPEQRRIAEVLDRAEALRVKRRAALAQLETLTQSIFLDMFGDPVSNPNEWPHHQLREALSIPLRNGKSPSRGGAVVARVLTLSAVTGDHFDPTAWKTDTFDEKPSDSQSVDQMDLLICRGNGSISRVGRGHFPSGRMIDVTFPDTMIAARVAPDRIERTFLQAVWNSKAVRRQVESLARTTNGTYKVNQSMLEGIAFIDPPRRLQDEFARRVAAVGQLKAAYQVSLANIDALFASLQHRAFRREL